MAPSKAVAGATSDKNTINVEHGALGRRPPSFIPLLEYHTVDAARGFLKMERQNLFRV